MCPFVSMVHGEEVSKLKRRGVETSLEKRFISGGKEGVSHAGRTVVLVVGKPPQVSRELNVTEQDRDRAFTVRGFFNVALNKKIMKE